MSSQRHPAGETEPCLVLAMGSTPSALLRRLARQPPGENILPPAVPESGIPSFNVACTVGGRVDTSSTVPQHADGRQLLYEEGRKKRIFELKKNTALSLL